MTLVEVTLSMTLLIGFAGAAVLALQASSDAYRTEAVKARLDAAARRALDEVAQRLREADFSALTPPIAAAPASASSVDLQRARGFAGGAVQWGPVERIAFEPEPSDPDDGLDNDGDGLVDEGRLVWIENPDLPDERRSVLCSDVTETLEGEDGGDGDDDNGNQLIDEGGFCIELDGRRAILRLTLAERDGDRRLVTRTATRIVTGRNTPEEE